MLSKIEGKVMNALYLECINMDSVLITPKELIKKSKCQHLTVDKLDSVLTDLCKDGYFDLIYSDRHGETVYCIILSAKGKAYKRSVTVKRRNVAFRIGLTVGLAFLSFIVGVILKALFS